MQFLQLQERHERKQLTLRRTSDSSQFTEQSVL